MAALVNDARVKAGKSTLGFLNPSIYQNTGAFNDIHLVRTTAVPETLTVKCVAVMASLLLLVGIH